MKWVCKFYFLEWIESNPRVYDFVNIFICYPSGKYFAIAIHVRKDWLTWIESSEMFSLNSKELWKQWLRLCDNS